MVNQWFVFWVVVGVSDCWCGENEKPDHVEFIFPPPQDVQSPQGCFQVVSGKFVCLFGARIASSSYYMQVPRIFQKSPSFHVQVPVL